MIDERLIFRLKLKTQPEQGVGNTKLLTDIKGSYPILNLELREDIHVTISGQKILYQLAHLLCWVYNFSLCRVWRLHQPVQKQYFWVDWPAQYLHGTILEKNSYGHYLIIYRTQNS